jgi:heavy metal sensor kinase
LTLWYVGVLGAVLVLAAGCTSAVLFWLLRSQLNHYAIQDLETVEGLLFFTPGGKLTLREDYHNHPESRQVLERLLEVLAPDGTVLYRNERLRGRALGGGPFANEGVGGYSGRSESLADGTRVRIVSRRHAVEGHPALIRLAYSEEPIWGYLRNLLVASLLVLPFALIVAGLAGGRLARRALAPIARITQRAARITSERLNERLPTAGMDEELVQLAQVFNSTFARLQHSFEQLRRFTSDASHELRTPLALMRSVGEVGLRKAASKEDFQEVVGSMLEEVNRLTGLVERLLEISRADSGSLELHSSVFSMLELARESAALFEVLVEEKAQHLTITGDERALVEGDREVLRQSVVNIVHNAVKYSPAGGAIRVAVDLDTAGMVLVRVADSGPGIPAEHRAKLFDRFYRVDPSRSRSEGGAGLGLSIAKWAVEAHGGNIRLHSAPGLGSTFEICLPAATRS